MNRNENLCWQQATDTTNIQIFPGTEYSRGEEELEQKAELLIARCYQILSEMQDKRDRLKLAF